MHELSSVSCRGTHQAPYWRIQPELPVRNLTYIVRSLFLPEERGYMHGK